MREEKEMPSLLIPEIVRYIGYLFHIFWMSMVFPKLKPNFQALISLLNIPLIDEYRLHIHNHLTNVDMLEKKDWEEKYAWLTADEL